jgi:hypothetical protein
MSPIWILISGYDVIPLFYSPLSHTTHDGLDFVYTAPAFRPEGVNLGVGRAMVLRDPLGFIYVNTAGILLTGRTRSRL